MIKIILLLFLAFPVCAQSVADNLRVTGYASLRCTFEEVTTGIFNGNDLHNRLKCRTSGAIKADYDISNKLTAQVVYYQIQRRPKVQVATLTYSVNDSFVIAGGAFERIPSLFTRAGSPHAQQTAEIPIATYSASQDSGFDVTYGTEVRYRKQFNSSSFSATARIGRVAARCTTGLIDYEYFGDSCSSGTKIKIPKVVEISASYNSRYLDATYFESNTLGGGGNAVLYNPAGGYSKFGETLRVANVTARIPRARLELLAEFKHRILTDYDTPIPNGYPQTFEGGFAMARFRVTNKLTVFGLYEKADFSVNRALTNLIVGQSRPFLARAGGGLHYAITPKLGFNVDYRHGLDKRTGFFDDIREVGTVGLTYHFDLGKLFKR